MIGANNGKKKNVKRLRILPYKPGSKSAKIIARALNGLRVRFNGTFKPRLRHLVLNWGKTETPRWWTGLEGLNHPEKVRQSSNKRIALQILKDAGVSIPEFTVDHEQAKKWFEAGKIVVGRKVLNGHGGIGCLIYDKKHGQNPGFTCPLYTLHLRHKREFRIHVFKARIIDMVEKRKRRGFEDRNSWIRNLHNGYVFARDNLQIPECVKQEALRATACLGLDFGAVDVAYREKEGKAYVFEVNTAPGVEGTTIKSYINAISEEMRK